MHRCLHIYKYTYIWEGIKKPFYEIIRAYILILMFLWYKHIAFTRLI